MQLLKALPAYVLGVLFTTESQILDIVILKKGTKSTRVAAGEGGKGITG